MTEGIRIISGGGSGGILSILGGAIGDLLAVSALSVEALPLFWVPVVICLCRTVVRFKGAYKDDLSKCGDVDYKPSLTVGFIMFRLLTSVLPVVNMLGAIYYLAGWIDDLSKMAILPKKANDG